MNWNINHETPAFAKSKMSGAESEGKTENKITFRVEFILTLFFIKFLRKTFLETLEIN